MAGRRAGSGSVSRMISRTTGAVSPAAEDQVAQQVARAGCPRTTRSSTCGRDAGGVAQGQQDRRDRVRHGRASPAGPGSPSTSTPCTRSTWLNSDGSTMSISRNRTSAGARARGSCPRCSRSLSAYSASSPAWRLLAMMFSCAVVGKRVGDEPPGGLVELDRSAAVRWCAVTREISETTMMPAMKNAGDRDAVRLFDDVVGQRVQQDQGQHARSRRCRRALCRRGPRRSSRRRRRRPSWPGCRWRRRLPGR